MIGSIRRSWWKLVPAAVVLAGMTGCQDQDNGSSFLEPPEAEVTTADVAVGFGFSSLTAQPGERVSVTLQAEAPDGMALGALQGVVSFDATELRFVGQVPEDGSLVLVKDRKSTRLNSSHYS